MASISQAQFMRLLAGLDQPGMDNIYADQVQQDPREQLVAQLGGAGLNDVIAQGAGLADLLGVNAQKEQYRFDDRWKVIGDLMDLQTAGAKAGIQAQQDQASLGMKQQQLSMDQGQYKSEYGDPEAQLRILMAKGYDPQSVVDLYDNTGGDDSRFEAGIAELDKQLGETDQYGQPLTVHSPGGTTRHNNLYNAAVQYVQQRQQAESDQMQKDRWKDLTPQFRAKEIYLRSQDPTQNVAVDRWGKVYTGDDAEQQAFKGTQSGFKPWKPKGSKTMSYKEWDQQTRQKGEQDRLKSKGVKNPAQVLNTHVSVPSAGWGMRFGA